MIYLKWFTDLSKEEWDKLGDAQKKKIRADHYVDTEVLNHDSEWFCKWVKWYRGGRKGDEPKQKNDWMKAQFNGCNLWNAFMEGIKFGEDLVKNDIKYE